jgi:hypothetical protein
LTASLLYRIAAVLFILFAAGHTFGFLTFVPDTAEGKAVFQSMTDVQFHVDGRSYTYGGFYRGFGIHVTVYLLFSAFLSWQLGQMSVQYPQAAGPIGWVFCAVQVAGLALSILYFFPIAAVFSGLLAVCVGLAVWRT